MDPLDSYSEDEDESTEEVSLTRSILATTEPKDAATVSEDLEAIFEESANRYYALQEKNSKKLKYGGSIIWPVQFAAARTFVESEGVTSLFAKTGMGKTLICVAAAEMIAERGDICVVFVPNGNVLKQWLSILGDYGLYKPKSGADSPWLVCDKTIASSQRDYLLSTRTRDIEAKKESPLVIIAIYNKTEEIMTNVLTDEVVGGREVSIIVDEAHNPNKLLVHVQQQVGHLVTRELLVSGSELTKQIMKKNEIASIDHTIHIFGMNKVPNDTWYIELLESQSYNENLDEWTDRVFEIASNSNRLLVFCEVEARKALIESGAFGDKKVYVTMAQKTLPEYNGRDDVVLILTHRTTTGLNVHADTIINLNPGDSTTEVLIQSTKRALRPASESQNVDIYMLCGTPKEYYRVLYAKAFSLLSWTFGRAEVVNTSMVYKALGAIRVLGHNHEEIDRVDLCIFLADYAELSLSGRLVDTFPVILEWWEKNKLETTILTPDIIRQLIIL